MKLNLYLGLAFLAATIATSCYKNKTELKQGLTSQLTGEEVRVYQEIIDNRRNIYLRGLGLGMIMSYLYLRVNPVNDSFSTGLSTVAITGIVNYFYYILHPKKINIC